MTRSLSLLAGACVLCFSTAALPSNLQCYGYTSTTSQFPCGTYGNCTWWAAYKRPDLAAAGISGNAENWYNNASGLGFQVGSEPKVGSIVVFSNAPLGHVAYTESLGENGSFSVSEMDFTGAFGSGVQSGTYSRNANGTYKRGNGSQKWALNGFIYRRVNGATNSYCDSISSIWGICWTPTSTDVSCQGGKDWTLYDLEQGNMIRVSTDEYCLASGGMGGGGTDPHPEASPTNLKLDFDVISISSQELVAGKVALTPLQEVWPRIQLSAQDGKVMDHLGQGEEAITSKVYRSINGGETQVIGTVDFTASKLDTGNRTLQQTFTGIIVPNLPGSKICFWAKIDTGYDVAESNEGDNLSRNECYTIASVPANVNLVVTSVAPTNTPIRVGGQMGAVMTILNQGTERLQTDASRVTYSIYGPGTNGVWQEIASDQVKADEVPPGVPHQEQIISLVTAPTVPGIYTLRGCADGNYMVPETNETDNCRDTTFEIQAIGPDFIVIDRYLIVGSGTICRDNCSMQKDSYIHPQCTVKNIGNASPSGNVEMRYYVDAGNYRDHDYATVSEMCPGCSKTHGVSTSNNSERMGSTGNRTYVCCVNEYSGIPELNRGNNCSTPMPFTVR